MAINWLCFVQAFFLAFIFRYAYTAETLPDAYDDSENWYFLYTSLGVCSFLNAVAVVVERRTALRISYACWVSARLCMKACLLLIITKALIHLFGVAVTENHESWNLSIAYYAGPQVAQIAKVRIELLAGAQIDQLLLAVLWVIFTCKSVLLETYDEQKNSLQGLSTKPP